MESPSSDSDTSVAEMDVSLDLKGWSDVLTYPRAIMRTAGNDDGKEEVTQLSWKVRVNARDTRGDHSSILEHKSTDGTRRKYSYLFWEASTVCGFSICISNARAA